MLKSMKLGFYKSYGESQNIEFAEPKPDEGKIGLTVLVGPNNSGKSSFLYAIRDLRAGNNEQIIFDQAALHKGTAPIFELIYERSGVNYNLKSSGPADSGYQKKVLEENGQPKTVAWIGVLIDPNLPIIRFVPSRRMWADNFSATSKTQGDTVDQNSMSAAPNSQAQLGQGLLELTRDGTKGDFNNLIKKILPDMHDWDLSRINNQDYIIYKTKFGHTHTLGLLGDGYSSVFRVAYTIFRSNNNEAIVLDEPELSLHPQAQRRLYELIREIAKTRQVIVATHSSYFINWRDLASGANLYRISKDSTGLAKIHSIASKTIAALFSATHKNIKNRKLYDVVAKEVFFADSVVFSEGQEDVHIIDEYTDLKGEPPIPFFGYGSGGASFIVHWLSMAADLGIKAVGLYDGDKATEANRVTKLFAANPLIRVITIGHDDIRDKHHRDGNCASGANCKEIDKIHKPGYFDQHWKIKPKEEPAFRKILSEIRSHLNS